MLSLAYGTSECCLPCFNQVSTGLCCWNAGASVMLTLCWVIVPDFWASALLSRSHSISLCIVNGLCRCAVLVLPASGFCRFPLIICLLMEMAFITTEAFSQSGSPVLKPPTLASDIAILSNGVIWEKQTPMSAHLPHYIHHGGNFYSSSSLMHWVTGDRLLLHIRFSKKEIWSRWRRDSAGPI